MLFWALTGGVERQGRAHSQTQLPTLYVVCCHMLEAESQDERALDAHPHQSM